MEAACTNNATLAPAACHEGCVGGHASACGENTHCCTHTFNILGIGLLADEDHLLTLAVPCHCILSGKDYLSHCSTGAGRKTLDQRSNLLLGCRVTYRVEKLIKLCGVNPHHSSLLINKTFLKHIHCHVQGCCTGTLAGTALKHVQSTFLNGELNVKHVMK